MIFKVWMNAEVARGMMGMTLFTMKHRHKFVKVN